MVNIDPGFYFCHVFDSGAAPLTFTYWETRASLPMAPLVLRYVEIPLDGNLAFINQLGFLVVFQRIVDAKNYAEAHAKYDSDFDSAYAGVLKTVHAKLGLKPIGETSCIVVFGSQEVAIDWSASHLPPTPLASTVLIEALFVDELCRALERHSESFIDETALVKERRLVEYAECLFPLSEPSGFLVDKLEIELMTHFYKSWMLKDRVDGLRRRFAESVTNTALYRGSLERNRQAALNSMLAAIACLSVAQVSKPISEVLAKLGIELSESSLNQFFAFFAVVVLFFGLWRYWIRPSIGLAWYKLRRAYLSWWLRMP
jgi:hypothetical protein